MFITIAFLNLLSVASTQFNSPPPHGAFCEDKVGDCNTYNYDETCRGEYLAWAELSCKRTCGYCDTCEDRLPNCAQYKADVCEKYPGWSVYNCAKTCNYCYKTRPTWNSTTCVDSRTNCPDYTGKVCVDASLKNWVNDNCPKYCGRCGCTDKLANCMEYWPNVCTTHRLWSIVNCAATCQLCASGLDSPAVREAVRKSTPPVVNRPKVDPALGLKCEDRLRDCGSYDKSTCKLYPEWAAEKCQKTCGYCGCEDKLRDCAEYGAPACSEPYLDWAVQNCARTCKLCDVSRALKDRETTTTCYDVSSECSAKSEDWCKKYPMTAWATCGKSCAYCDCADAYDRCALFKPSEFCRLQYGKDQCKRTCGLCLSKPTASQSKVPSKNGRKKVLKGGWLPVVSIKTASPSCTDVQTSCAQLKLTGLCTTGDPTFVKRFCAKTCGICDSCTYKGKGRRAGETWSEGCAVECSCSPNGTVTCKNRCPTWNLAYGCVFKPASDGSCCKTPSCPSGVQIQQPTPNY